MTSIYRYTDQDPVEMDQADMADYGREWAEQQLRLAVAAIIADPTVTRDQVASAIECPDIWWQGIGADASSDELTGTYVYEDPYSGVQWDGVFLADLALSAEDRDLVEAWVARTA